MSGVPYREAHLPAQQARPRPSSWLPRPYGHRWWSSRDRRPPSPGPQAPVRLSFLMEAPGRGLTVGRLKRRPEFLRVAATRCKWAAPGLILQAAPAASETPPPSGGASVTADHHPSPETADLRVGFTCSKKVGNSVARNRAKRRLRAAAAELLPNLARPGFDYVLIGRHETLRRPYVQLLQDLRTALKRVGALRDQACAETKTEGGK